MGTIHHVTSPGQPPNTDAEWARDTENRMRRLESPNTMRIGPWVISSRDGELIATKPGDEIVFGQLPDDDTVPDSTRGYVSDQLDKKVELIEDSIGNPNGGGGLPKIKDFLNGKWDDLVATQEVADSRAIAGNNIVSNPGFNKEGFYLGDGTYVTDIKRTGTQAARVVANGTLKRIPLTVNATGELRITATPGDIFYVEAWVWGASANTQTSGGANGIAFYIDVFNTAGAKLGSSLTTTSPTAGTGLSNQWTKFTGYIAIPNVAPYNGAATMTPYLILNTNVTPGDVYTFDDPIVRVDSLVNSWSYIHDGVNGTTGSFGKLPFDLLNPLQNLRATAINAASGASGALNTAQMAASGASGAYGRAQGTIDAIVAGLKAWTGIDLDPPAVKTSAEAISGALATLSTVVSNLRAQRDAGMFYGVALEEVFADYTISSTLGAKWTTWSSGTGTAVWGIDADYPGYSPEYAAMKPLAGAVTRHAGVRLVEQTLTKYQRIGVVLASVGGNTQAAPTSGIRHYFRIYGRVNADRTQYVFAEFRATEVIIGFNTGSGGDQWIAHSLKPYTYKPGTPYWLECGTSQAAPRTYKLWEGTTAITTGVDGTGSSPNSDTDHLGAGFGGWVEDHRYTPPKVAGFSLLDNVPPHIRGMGFRAYNTTDSSSFNVDGSGDVQVQGFFPTNWFNTEPDYCTSNMLYDSSTNTLTVSEPGHYAVTIAQRGSWAAQAYPGRVAAGIFVDEGSGEFFAREFAPATAWSNIKESFGGVFTVYLQGGDKIRPGWKSWWETTGTNSYKGSSQGETYWSVTFLHNRYEKVTTVE